MEKILSCTGLTKYYGGLPALSEVSVNLYSGRITLLAGSAGAGKSTFLRIAAGMAEPTDGSITVCGMKPGHRANEITAYLPDRDFFPEDERLIDIVRFYKRFFNDFSEEKAFSLLGGISADITKRFGAFSRSMKGNIQAAFIASRQARVYLLDEPLLSSGKASRELILSEFFAKKKDDAAVVITYPGFLSEREDHAGDIDDLLLLQNGTVKYCGPAGELPAQEKKGI